MTFNDPLEEVAIHRLIKRATRRRDWLLLTVLFYELGSVFLEQEGRELPPPGLPSRPKALTSPQLS